MTVGFLGLILSVALLIFLAYKGVSAFPLSIIAAVLIMITNGLGIWETLTTSYLEGYTSFLASYLFVFASSALYAKLMDESGAAIAIGYKFIDWFGKKKAVLSLLVISAILNYGGISLFVIIFAIAPIGYLLLKEADISRNIMIGIVGAGTCTFTMTCLPGSTAIQNLVPTQYLGTKLTAAPVMGILAAIFMFVLQYLYLQWEAKRLKKAGEHFTFPKNYDSSAYEVERSELPSTVSSFAPMVVLVVAIIALSRTSLNPNMIVVICMLVASLLCLILHWNRLKGKGIKGMVNDGLTNGISSIVAPCAIMAFGEVVKVTPAYEALVDRVLSMDMNPYIVAVISIMIIAAVTGSASGGLTIALNTMAPTFIASGVNLNILHRLIAIASCSLDSLPHSPGLFMMLVYVGLTHKEGYRSIFATTVVVPCITTAVFTAAVVLLGL